MPNIIGQQEFFIKRNDRLPNLSATLTSDDGSAIDLTGATVNFIMRTENSTAPKIDAAATIVTSTLGMVSYAWSTGDTDTAGDYLGEFEITHASGKVQTVPNDKELAIYVRRDLG